MNIIHLIIFTHLCNCPETAFTLFGSLSSLRVYQRGGHILYLPSAELPKPQDREKKRKKKRNVRIWALMVF